MVKVPENVKVFDNDGKTYDRYTVFFPDGAVYTMSVNALSPLGVCMYVGEEQDVPKVGYAQILTPVHVGEKIKELLI